jgi:ankyrin repeat protein
VNQTFADGTTPLYTAAQEGHLEIVNVLLGSEAAV